MTDHNTEKNTSSHVRTAFKLALCIGGLQLAGCANINGGLTLSHDEENTDFCTDIVEMENRVELLSPGMAKQDTLHIIADSQNTKHVANLDAHLSRLDREGVFDTLYPSSAQLEGTIADMEESRAFLDGMQGLELACENVHKRGGLAFKGIETSTTGYGYSVRMIFNEEGLFDVVLNGGATDHKSKQSYFKMTANAAREFK